MPTRAIVVFPAGDALVEIDRLRAKFDPLASAIAPHITLVFPFASDETGPDLRAHIERAVSDLPAFPIRLSGITGHDDEYLFLGVAHGADGVIALHDRLYSGDLARHRSLDHVYVPHLTVGRLRDRDLYLEAVSETSSLDITLEADVHEIAIVQSLAPDSWSTELVVGLGP